ncbi:MAG: 50S ribosomal protein L24 [bacterium]|nr:50S ribosomal protein L24 [Candidatus Microgenomates bacterium CPR3]MCQ3944580.1 50S ribosomal protein L24 [bacterium]RIK51124.1 MAG: 50S ribosomal protein L24 [Candidatus Microgenomates bacterium]
MSTKKFKKGDIVLVTAGRDKGKSGKITKINQNAGTAIVEGVALYKRHIKPTQNSAGGMKSIERAISFAKIALTEDGKAIRIGLKRDNNKTVRISKKTGKSI